MREENISRLNRPQTGVHDRFYLHHRSLFSALQWAISTYAQGEVFDIGCGNKPYETYLSCLVTSYRGCDIVQSSERRVDVLCPATRIPVASRSVDSVISTQVIEHVCDHQEMLTEAWRILRPSGCLILSAPMYWPLHEEPYDFFRFTRHGLVHLLEKAGFETVEIRVNGGDWATLGQAIIHTIMDTHLDRGVIIQGINLLFSFLDDRFPKSRNPMNYVVVARKPMVARVTPE